VVLTRLEGPEGRAAGDLAVDETEVLLALDVPGLVRARDVVTADEPGGTARHLVLDHVPGVGLDALREAGPIQPAEALDAVVQAAGVLAGLHRQGLLHTDVTPANLRRGPDGVTVMDLGSLRRLDDRTTDVWGTTGFLAPEICPGGAGPSVASEVYGLARTVAVLIADFDHLRSRALRLPDPATTRVLADNPALTRLLCRATDPDPAGRHPDVSTFAAEAAAVRDVLGALGEQQGARR
jgi:serine/threonine protein kinase